MNKETKKIMLLESVILSEKSVIKKTTPTRPGFLKATREVSYMRGDYKRIEVTHYIELNTETGLLKWVNNRRGIWEFKFETPLKADEWWTRMILSRSVQKQAAVNEMDA